MISVGSAFGFGLFRGVTAGRTSNVSCGEIWRSEILLLFLCGRVEAAADTAISSEAAVSGHRIGEPETELRWLDTGGCPTPDAREFRENAGQKGGR
jgi:hypothetical protein